MRLPTLYKKTAGDAIQQWTIGVDYPMDAGLHAPAVIVTTYGQVGGKLTEATELVEEGKNIGKKNETTPHEQAIAQAEAKWMLQKKRRAYVDTIEQAQAGEVDDVVKGGRFPMLAEKFKTRRKKMTYPALAQPKLDGHRCIAIVEDGVCTLWTRTRKLITSVPHINRAIEKLSRGENWEYDGELYCHAWVIKHGKEEAFEMVGKIVRTIEPVEGHEEIQYNLYDMPVEEPALTFEQRFSDLYWHFNRAEEDGVKIPELILVETVEVNDEAEAIAYYEDCLERGYEGAMLRSRAGVYYGHPTNRSDDLLKMKLMEDAEFQIVNVIEGYKGKMKGKGIFVCAAGNGETFEVVMNGKLEKLTEYWTNKDKYIGKQLTVEYQGLTHAKKVPRIPRGLRFREAE